MNKSLHIIGGGTVKYIASHLAVCAPAYGGTARRLHELCMDQFDTMSRYLHLTKMAGGKSLETNDDVEKLIDQLVQDENTKIVILNASLVDFGPVEEQRHYARLSTHNLASINVELFPLPKIVTKIRKHRKDIFLIAFKHTCGLSADEQYQAGLDLCKRASANLVFANDEKTRLNMVITPEEARYHETTDRMAALQGMLDIAKIRSQGNFTRSTVVDGQPVPWDSETIPTALKTVVDHCISRGAYKPFRGSTAGHFACKLTDNTFLTSIRKSNFNHLDEIGLVKVMTDGPDSVIAFGAKPSVGGQSQRIVFSQHPEYDCIVHFHCPLKLFSQVPVASQREFECGSHQCGQNASSHLKKFGNLSAMFMDQHGPLLAFNHSIDPQEVINLIEINFDLEDKTGGVFCCDEHNHVPVVDLGILTF